MKREYYIANSLVLKQNPLIFIIRHFFFFLLKKFPPIMLNDFWDDCYIRKLKGKKKGTNRSLKKCVS